MKSKWDIQHPDILNKQQRQQYWKHAHCHKNYDSVWNMTEDEGVRRKILDALTARADVSTLLILGCGSRVLLQNEIARHYPEADILCTYFPAVIDKAASQPNADNIRYEERDSKNLGFDGKWDAVIVVNSILSESDAENSNILRSCCLALKTGGVLIGFFPTIFATLEIAHLKNDEKWLECIDIKKSSFYEQKQKLWQIFYTLLRLRFILREAGFAKETIEIFFCDSEYFLAHARDYYGVEDADMPLYEQFVVAYKRR